jgi:ketosteroid isomerase-like protein
VSRENVELVRTVQPSGVDLVALNRELPEAFAALPGSVFADDFESVFMVEDAPTRLGPFRGAQGFVAGWSDWLEPWESYEIEAEEFIDADDQVVVFARVRARTRRDKVEVEHSPAAVWTVRDGLVRRIEFYLERASALRAAGLEP